MNFFVFFFLGKGIEWPNGLTIDLVGERIYWVDAKAKVIESANYAGDDRRTVLRGFQHLKHPFSVAVFEVNLFEEFRGWN